MINFWEGNETDEEAYIYISALVEKFQHISAHLSFFRSFFSILKLEKIEIWLYME